MKRHGIFGGWFTLGGVRGRLSYLFSSIFSYLFFTVLIYLLFLFGFQAFLGVALTGSQLPTEYIRYFIYVPLFLVLWIYTCIEVQRCQILGT